MAVARSRHPGGWGAALGVRAEHVRLDPAGAGMPATVEVVQPLGPATHVTVAWEGGRLTGRLPGIAPLQPGDPIGVSLDPAGLLFFDRRTGQRIEI